MQTNVNGQRAEWSEETWAAWRKEMEGSKLDVLDANRFTPRPYQDEWSKGSREFGFVYTARLDSGRREVYYFVTGALQVTPRPAEAEVYARAARK